MTREATSGAASSCRLGRKVVVAVLGSGVVVLGVALVAVPVPGPAIILIPLGLAILAREFLWAQNLLQPVRKLLRRLKEGARRVLGRPSPPVDPEVKE